MQNTMPSIAQTYAEFNALHAQALAASPRSTQYQELLSQMEMIVADMSRAFGRRAVRREER